MEAENTEGELIRALQSGDETAYRHAVRAFTPAMMSVARRLCDPGMAEEVVQEAWVKVLDAIQHFQGRSALQTWLCAITLNQARQSLRHRRRERPADFQDPLEQGLLERFTPNGRWLAPFCHWGHEPADRLLEQEALQGCLERHLTRLSPTQRAVLEMRDMRQMSFEEVCNVLDLGASNVRVLLHRARQRILAMLDHFRETGEC